MTMEEYNNIIECLDRNDLEGLRKYVENQVHDKKYLEAARAAIRSYMKSAKFTFSVFCYEDKNEKSLLLSDGHSIYILNTDEVLDKKTKEKMSKNFSYNGAFINWLTRIKQTAKKMSEQTFEDPISIESTGEHKMVESHYTEVCSVISPTHGKLTFNKGFLNTAAKILGKDVKFLCCKEDNKLLQAKSDKGSAYILGIGNPKTR